MDKRDKMTRATESSEGGKESGDYASYLRAKVEAGRACMHAGKGLRDEDVEAMFAKRRRESAGR